jgi:hypothetical protein
VSATEAYSLRGTKRLENTLSLKNKISDQSKARSLKFTNSGLPTLKQCKFALRDAPFAKTDYQRFCKIAQVHFSNLRLLFHKGIGDAYIFNSCLELKGFSHKIVK